METFFVKINDQQQLRIKWDNLKGLIMLKYLTMTSKFIEGQNLSITITKNIYICHSEKPTNKNIT